MSEMLFIMWVQVINVNNGFVVDQAVKWFQCEGDISSREDGRASGAGWIHFPSLSPDRSDKSDWNEIDCANNVTAARHRNDTGWTRLGCARRSAHSNVKDLFVSVRLPHKWNNMTESPSDKMRLLLRMTNQQLNRLMFLTLVMHCNPKAVYQKSVVLYVGLGFFFCLCRNFSSFEYEYNLRGSKFTWNIYLAKWNHCFSVQDRRQSRYFTYDPSELLQTGRVRHSLRAAKSYSLGADGFCGGGCVWGCGEHACTVHIHVYTPVAAVGCKSYFFPEHPILCINHTFPLTPLWFLIKTVILTHTTILSEQRQNIQRTSEHYADMTKCTHFGKKHLM